MNHVPTKVFFTKGVGMHRERPSSFEDALRRAGIEKQNPVYVSNILPTGCRTRHTCHSAEGHKSGRLWATVIAAAVFILW